MKDPVLREIVQNALDTITDEVGVFSARSAYSPFVNQSGEIATAIFDPQGRLVAQTKRGLAHASAVRIGQRELLKDWPLDSMEDGDAFVFNDHFRGGIHPTDVMVFRPIFHDGRVAFIYGAMMIVSDLGGLSAAGLPANATECFHEGLMIPGVRLYQRGQPNRDVVAMIEANSRTPRRVMGDIRALVAGGNMAALRMLELIEKYGYADLTGIIEELMDRSETLTRQGIDRIPDGSYEGSYIVEEDGIVPDKSYTIRARITVRGGDIEFDFAGSDPQARGAVNSSFSQSLSGVVFALLCYLDDEIPMNEGFYRPIEVKLPLGSIVNPRYPAACNIRIGTVQAIVDSIIQAFAPAFPDRVQAPGGTPHSLLAAGRHPKTGEMWAFLDPHFGPCGARSTKDGVDCMPDPLFAGQSGYGRNIETYELEFPVRYERFEVWRDSGGPGKWRGGCGLIKEVTFLADNDLTVRAVDRCRIPPQGLAGGKPGKGGGWIVNRGRTDEWSPPPKQTNIRVGAGTMVTQLVSGGGGFGSPDERAPELVARDVREGYVSLESAARDYRVVIDRATGGVDMDATLQLRKS
jgi:N-methylhydantoinase B